MKNVLNNLESKLKIVSFLSRINSIIIPTPRCLNIMIKHSGSICHYFEQVDFTFQLTLQLKPNYYQ